MNHQPEAGTCAKAPWSRTAEPFVQQPTAQLPGRAWAPAIVHLQLAEGTAEG
jgi:hypothetical protein